MSDVCKFYSVFCWWTMTAKMMANFRAWRILFVALVFFSFAVNNYLRTMGSLLFAWDWAFPSLSLFRCECPHSSLSLITLYFCFCANLHTKFGHKPFIVCKCMIVPIENVIVIYPIRSFDFSYKIYFVFAKRNRHHQSSSSTGSFDFWQSIYFRVKYPTFLLQNMEWNYLQLFL